MKVVEISERRFILCIVRPAHTKLIRSRRSTCLTGSYSPSKPEALNPCQLPSGGGFLLGLKLINWGRGAMAAFGYAAFGWLLAIAAIGLGIFVFLCAVAVLQVWWRSITKR